MKKLFLLLAVFVFHMELQAQQLLIGTYTNKGTSKGIYVYDFDTKTGGTKLKLVMESVNPSYLSVYNREWIYNVNENGESSGITAFHLDQKGGKATRISSADSKGKDPCYILTDKNHIFVANYSSGTIAVYERNEKDGSIGEFKQLITHTGKSIDPQRQTSAHVHQVLFTPDQKYIISNDLGEDQIYIYAYNANSKGDVLTPKTIVKTSPGTGPRHLAFSPNGKFAYLTHEFNGAINVYSYHDGTLTKLQEVSTVAKDFKGKIDGADIHVSADGKFLYQTNRGNANAISVFEISPAGLLNHMETVSTLGKGPRNFTIDPSGNFLLVAHQNTDNVVIFKRDQRTGKLSDTGQRINLGAPVCLVFNK